MFSKKTFLVFEAATIEGDMKVLYSPSCSHSIGTTHASFHFCRSRFRYSIDRGGFSLGTVHGESISESFLICERDPTNSLAETSCVIPHKPECNHGVRKVRFIEDACSGCIVLWWCASHLLEPHHRRRKSCQLLPLLRYLGGI